MRKRIGSSVIFTIVRGRVLDNDKEAVAEFLGSEANEQEFSRLGYTAFHTVLTLSPPNPLLAFLRRITPEGSNFELYKGPSVHDGGGEECVLAEVVYSS